MTKVISYQRYNPSPWHVHAGVSELMFYVPELQVIFGESSVGSFSPAKAFICSNQFLEEAKQIADGKIPEIPAWENIHRTKVPDTIIKREEEIPKVVFSEIKEFEFDINFIRTLVDNIRNLKTMESHITESMKLIKEKIGSYD